MKPKKIIAFFLSLVFSVSFVLCACGEEDGVPSVPRTTEYTVTGRTLDKTVTADEEGRELLFTVSVSYPEFSNPGGLETVDALNEMYASNAQAYIDAVTEEFETQALVIYEANKAEFEPYSFNVDYEVTYNKNCILSIKREYREKYNMVDGDEVYADTYDMSVGLPLYADEIVTGKDADILKIIFLGFTSVAEEFPERFADGYVDIINETIGTTEFYLTDTGMTFILQPGVATYPEYGVLTFEMPFEGNEAYFARIFYA